MTNDTAIKREGGASQLNDMLCFTVYSTAHAFNRVYKPLLDALELTYPQYLVMLGLWERDGVTVKQIGEQLHLDSGTLTPLLKRLESAGLVRRARDAADERQVRISLTPKGTALHEKARTVGHGFVDACKQTRDELKTLNAQLVKLRDKLNAS
ncbi:MAG TPA: MarR family transcriptional regulator [Xanthobacteraceae bacterium]|nr:MarR family transcriptional regulator [Xanthobacteraceae bacterium]